MRVRFGNNENQRSHAFRYVREAGLDIDAVQYVIEADLRRLSLLDGLNKGTLEYSGVLFTYHAFKFTDGDVNVGRITITDSAIASSPKR